MRIGIATPGLGFVGGVELYAHNVARALSRRGHRTTLVHGSLTGHDAEAYAEPFERVVPQSEAHRLRTSLDVVYVQRAGDVGDLASFEGLPLATATHDHDLTCVRSHRYLPMNQEPCHRAPGLTCLSHGCFVVRDRRPGARLPVTVRNPMRLRASLRRLAQRGPLVACSRYVAGHLIRAGVPHRRVQVVPPVPPEDARPLMPPPPEPRLLVVGQLLRGKGFDIAIEALRHLPAEVTLAVVGDGPSRPALERAARRVARLVRFCGWTPPDRMSEQYDRASVVVVPSRWPEPFGMVGIEAMRRGRPVVGAGHGGIPEWLEPGQAGELFSPGSPEALAGAVRRLLGDAEAGERAYHFVRRHFDHARSIDRLEHLLDGLAHGRRA